MSESAESEPGPGPDDSGHDKPAVAAEAGMPWPHRTVGDGMVTPVWSADDRPDWGHPGVRDGSVVYPLLTAGAVLRTARAYARLSQRELAERAELAQSTVARIEAARTSPRWPVVFRCVTECGLTFALLAPDGEVIWHQPLVVDRDAAGRHYPAHLPVRRIGPWGQPWRYRHNVPDLGVTTPPFVFRRRHPTDPPDPAVVRRRRRQAGRGGPAHGA